MSHKNVLSKMEDSDLKGCPIPLLMTEGSGGELKLNDKAIEILSQDHIKNRAAVVISVAGAFRKGKSFLLDFFLRYMNLTYASSRESNIANYLGDENSPLKGFDWRCGSTRCTTGIFIWSEIFCATLPNGEEVAVILLDTQGAFDSESTVQECSTIFAISTMISSIQIYNLSQNIQEDNLEYLELFIEYGKLALQNTEKAPFQKLLFLVRDWQYGFEIPYGNEGGRQYVGSKLSESVKPELKSLREHIKSCFTDVDGFLLPYPGNKVATNPTFDGRLSDIDEEFKEYLHELLTLLLSRENLLPKEICGHKVKVKELKQYLKFYTNLFTNGDLPKPQCIFQATANANNFSELIAAEELYKQSMEACCRRPESYLTSEEFESKHVELNKKALQQFREKPKIGGNKLSKPHLIKLKKKIKYLYSLYKSINDDKIRVEQQKENIKAAAAAREMYHLSMKEVCIKDTNYLSSYELKSQHEVLKKLALKKFDAECKTGGNELFIVLRLNLENNIDIDYVQYESCNKLKEAKAKTENESAVAAARKSYRQLMLEVCGKPNASFKPDDLESIHKECSEKAFEQFHEQCGTERGDFLDYRKNLEQDIKYDYAQFKSNNENMIISKKEDANAKNLLAVAVAKDTYRKLMMKACEEFNANTCSDALELEHDKIKRAALSQSFESCEIAEDEYFRKKLEQDIEAEYVRIRNHNEKQSAFRSHANSLSAVTASEEKYCQSMEEVFEEPTAYVNFATLADEHIRCEKEAFDQFQAICETGGNESSKIYRTKLKQGIEDKYNQFKARNEVNAANAKKKCRSAFEMAAVDHRFNMILFFDNVDTEIYIDSDTLESEHLKYKSDAINIFRANSDVRANDYYVYYSEKLEKVINEKYSEFCANMESITNSRRKHATSNNFRAVAGAKHMILTEMRSFIETQNTNSDFSFEMFETEFIRCKENALSWFKTNCSGGAEFSRKYIVLLEKDIMAEYTPLKETVEEIIKNKRIFNYLFIGGNMLMSFLRRPSFSL